MKKKLAIGVAIGLLILGGAETACALSILFNQGSSLDVESRLTGLGHTLTISSGSAWGASFDYSPYDVVAFEFGSTNPADIGNLVNAVTNGDVGVVFFRGYGADSTAQALGLISAGALSFQTPTDLNILDNSHYITSGFNTGVQNLGYTYMSSVYLPGANTTVLATGNTSAALVVHNSLRATITPFYGHFANYNLETSNSMQITERTLQWAAGADVTPVPEPASMLLFGTGITAFAVIRRKTQKRQN